MLRPSWRGDDSTIAISATSSAILFEDLQAELGVGHLTTTEHDRELDLVALAQEPLDVLHLGRVVVAVDLGPELHLLDDDVRGLLARLLAPLLLLVLPAPVVHDPADRRVGVGRDLDEIQLLLAGDCQRLRQRPHPELFAVCGDQQHFSCADAVVDPCFVGGCDVGITSHDRRPPAPSQAAVTSKEASAARPGSVEERTTRTRWHRTSERPRGTSDTRPGRVGPPATGAGAARARRPTSQLDCRARIPG